MSTFGIKINCKGKVTLSNVSATVPDGVGIVVVSSDDKKRAERPLTHSRKIYCRKCRGNDIIENITGMTEMCEGSHVDEQGYTHLHSGNYMSVDVTCRDCGEKFHTKKYSVCWCGWSENGR